MFSNLNWWEIMGLALLGLFIFGPERLPKVISEGVRMLRGLREMARNGLLPGATRFKKTLACPRRRTPDP